MSMLRTIKPKSARTKRFLESREPKVEEDEKTAVFVYGQKTSDKVRTAMQDLYALKRPNAINFSRKNDVHPMQDASSYEFWAQKNDASLFVTGLHSKKRPDNIVFTRMYDGRVLDMVELGIEAAKGIKDFAGVKAALSSRPLMVFHSDLFDTHPTFQSVKSHLLDFYNGHPLIEYPLTTIEHVISITAGPLPPSSSASAVAADPDAPGALPLVHLRVYTIRLHPTSAGRAPRFELTEMGPALDFRIRRVQDADPGQMKAALKRPKLAKKDVESGLGKKRKNVETDDMGDKVGKLHVGKQDLSKLQGRKMKGLKIHKEGGLAPSRGAGGMEVDADA